MKQAKLSTPQTAQINVRIERSLKEEGDAALAEAGLSPTQVVRDLWSKLAQRGTAIDQVVEALGTGGYTSDERAAIQAKLAVLDRVARRRDELAARLSLSATDAPIYADGYDWRDRVQQERERKWDRRGIS